MDGIEMDFSPGIIDISKADRKVWLVKVPDYFAERLNDLEEDGLDLGTVRIHMGSSSGPSATGPATPRVTVELNTQGPCSDLPSEYNLRFSRCDQQMHIFCEDMAGRAVRIEGKVEQICSMNPLGVGEEYRRVMRARNEEANRPKRTIQLVHDEQESARVGMVKHVNEHEMLMRKKRKNEPDLRRERLPREDVIDLIFRAFERIPHWTFKGLIEETQQPSVRARIVSI